MPEPNPQHVRGEVFKRNVAALPPSPPVELKGGIISPDNYKSFVVNIRPRKWHDKFWIGKIASYLNAQFIADLVFYYSGLPSFHLKNTNFNFPPLECMGSSTPLTDREMCLKYASSIAQGPEFKDHRHKFRERVKELALKEVSSVEVQRILLQLRDESGPSAVPVEVEGVKGVKAVEGVKGVKAVEGDDDDDEGVQAGHHTPMEVDDAGEQAARLSLVPSAEDGLEAVKGRNVRVPGFDMSGPGFNLQSADLQLAADCNFSGEHRVCMNKDFKSAETLWVDDYLSSLEYDDSGDHLGSLNNDEGDLCSVTRCLEKNSFDLTQCSSALENFEANFFAMEDARVDRNQ